MDLSYDSLMALLLTMPIMFGMAFSPRLLPVQQLLLGSSSLFTRDLPKTVYRGLILEFNVNHTNGASPVISIDSLLAFVSRIAIVIDGQDYLISLQARDLYYMNQADYSVAPFSSLFTTVSSTGTSTFQIYIPLALSRALRPEDTLLDARKVSTVVLEIQTGASIGTGVTTINSANVNILTDEYANAPAEMATGRHEMNAIDRNLDATGLIQQNLEVGSNNQYRRLLVFTRTSADVLDNAQISGIAVRSRSFYYANVTLDQMLQQWSTQLFGLAFQTGLYPVPFTRDGQMTQRVDARNLSELVVEVTSLVSNGKLRIVKDKAIFASEA